MMPLPGKDEKTDCGDYESPAKEIECAWREHARRMNNKRRANYEPNPQLDVMDTWRAGESKQETIGSIGREYRYGRQGAEVEAGNYDNGKSQCLDHRYRLISRLTLGNSRDGKRRPLHARVVLRPLQRGLAR